MKDEREWAVPQGLTMAEEVALRRKLGLEPKLKGGHMDRKRDGPFEIGDRVVKENGGVATVIGIDTGHKGMVSKPYPNHLRHASGNENWWPDDELTLISPTTEPVAQEEEIKVGDRVRRLSDRYGVLEGLFVGMEKDSIGIALITRDDGVSGGGPHGEFQVYSHELAKITTEPIAAQKETKMKAYFWIAWKKDEDGKRAELVGGDDHMWMVVAENEAEARRKADFKLAETLELEKPDDITNFEVEVHPFGG